MKSRKFQKKNQSKTPRLPKVYPSDELSWSYKRWCTIPLPVYTNATSSLYSFNSSTDIRYVSFSGLLTASSSWNYLTNVFRYYTIMALQMRFDPLLSISTESDTNTFPPLCGNLELNIVSPANPVNTTVITSNNAMRHPLSKITSTDKTFITRPNPSSTFNTAMNNKYSTLSQPSSGAIVIGNYLQGTFPASNQCIGILNVNVCILFEGSIA